MTYRDYRFLVYSDLYRIEGKAAGVLLLRRVLGGGAFKYTFWMRTCRYTKTHPIFKYTVYPFAWFTLHRLKYKLGISISPQTEVGSGFYIGHFGGIFVNSQSVIGKNCNISQGVTLGKANRGTKKGCPIVGDNVYIVPGAKIVGQVRIGNNVAIGANCVVTKDIPDHSVVVGVPGKVISKDGAAEYVNRTEYESVLRKC